VKLNARDRRALALLAGGLVVVLGLRFLVYSDKSVEPGWSSGSIPLAETRLNRLRQISASLPAKEEVLKKAIAEVELREKGVLKADTAPQAQAQLLQIIRRLGKAEGVDVRGGEMGPVRNIGDDYGETAVAVSFECRIEQLVNLLAAIANEPSLIATNSLRINVANPKEKTVNVRLDVAGVVPRALAPEKKGTTF
jgi:hypothetical protein